MPEDGVELSPESALLTADEIERLVTLFAAEGVTKVRLTGGEPLVRKDAVDICARIGRIQGIETLAMTTNGLTLARNIPKLVDAGLSHVNLSLDTLVDFKYEIVTRRKGHSRVLKALDAAVDAGLRVKLNCVVMQGFNDDELRDFVRLTQDRPIDVRFIEYMPFAGNGEDLLIVALCVLPLSTVIYSPFQ